MENQNTSQQDRTMVTLLRNGQETQMPIKEFLANSNYILSHGEPIWFSSHFYKKPTLFIGDMNNQLVFVGPYLAGEGIVMDKNPESPNIGEIKLRYPIPVITGRAGDVLCVNETETGLEWRYTNIKHGTTEYWKENCEYTPEPNRMIIYDDAIEKDGIKYPALKIGTGNAYVNDLPFVVDQFTFDKIIDDFYRRVQDLENKMVAHINDHVRHVTQADKNRWDVKLNIKKGTEEMLIDETLEFTRE